MIQPELKIFPHTIPPVPEKGQALPETVQNLLDWAKEATLALSDITKQTVEKYNAHVSGTHNHPQSWKAMRVPRPRFQYGATDKVVVVASASVPVIFVIGGQIFEVTSTLTCDLDGTGPGGLDTGTKAADMIYYLYAINSSGTPALVSSVIPPYSELTAYPTNTYLGAFRTIATDATVPRFVSSRGRYISDNKKNYSHTGDTNWTSTGTLTIPLTTRFTIGNLGLSWSAVGWGAVAPTSVPSTLGTYLEVGSGATGYFFSPHAEVPVINPQTLYLKTSVAGNTVYYQIYGWIEDPTEYP